MLPEATIEIVQKGFVFNGELDSVCNSLTSLENLLHSYRGDLKHIYLEKKRKISDGIL